MITGRRAVSGVLRSGMIAWIGCAAACGHDDAEGRLAQLHDGPGLGALTGTVTSGGDATGGDASDATTVPDVADASDATTITDAATDATTVTDTVVVDVGPIACHDAGDCPAPPDCRKAICHEGTCDTAADPLAVLCDDGDPCTLVDGCSAGACVGHGGLVCTDLDPCTDDACTPGVGCAHAIDPCDDGDACTADRCVAFVGCVRDAVSCPPIADPCLVAECVPAVGCTAQPRPGHPSCNDNDACTSSDQCADGACHGTPKTCDDGDPCTSDACDGGDCTATPIPDCVADAQCVGKDPGAGCDDKNAATSGDLCLVGVCHGFAPTRVPATAVSDAAGLVVTETDYGPDGWSAVFWTIDSLGDESWSLARTTSAAAPFVYTGSTQAATFDGLRDGFVADGDGYVWDFDGGAWGYNNTWSNTLIEGDLGVASDLWTTRDTANNGAAGARRVWVVGNDGTDEWMRYCHEAGAGGAVTCDVQDLDDFQSSSWPTALWGVPACSGGACSGALLATAADAAAGGGGWYNDTYENDGGTESRWSKGSVPGAPASRVSKAIVGWGDATSAQFLAVGSGGYIVHRRTSGTWSAPLALRDGQSSRTFSGVWEGAGIIALAATRPGANQKVEHELWTCPSGKDVEIASNWSLHSLGNGPAVSLAGVYDVAGRPEGELRVVGAIKKEQGDPGSTLLEGLIYVRAP